MNKQNAAFNQVMGARVEKLLKNTNFFPAIPGILLKALNILNWENYDKTSPEHDKERLLKDITQLTEAQSAQPQFSLLFKAINRKMSEEPYKTAFQRASQWANSAGNANEASSSAANTPSKSYAPLSSSQHSQRR